MTKDEEQLRILLERLQESVSIGLDCIELGKMRDAGGYVDPGLNEGEMAIGDFIVRGRFSSLNQMMGKE